MDTEVLRIVERARQEHERARLPDSDLDGVAVADDLAKVVRDRLRLRIDFDHAQRRLQHVGREGVEELLPRARAARSVTRAQHVEQGRAERLRGERVARALRCRPGRPC